MRCPMTNYKPKYIVVPDIHGEFDKLERLMQRIDGQLYEGDTIVFLGDYVDRGADSQKVLSYLHVLKQSGITDVKILLGNHDYYFIKFMDKRGMSIEDIEWAARYMTETLKSFKLKPELYSFLDYLRGVDFLRNEQIINDLSYKMWVMGNLNEVRWTIRNHYQNELNVLRQAQAYHIDDNYVFSHSGGVADKPFNKQTIVEVVESRDFRPRQKLHVVGHTPQEKVKHDKEKNILFCDVGCVFIEDKDFPVIMLAKEPDAEGNFPMSIIEEHKII